MLVQKESLVSLSACKWVASLFEYQKTKERGWLEERNVLIFVQDPQSLLRPSKNYQSRISEARGQMRTYPTGGCRRVCSIKYLR